MIRNLLLGLPVMILCLVMQLSLLVAAMRFYKRRNDLVSSASFMNTLSVVSAIMLLLMLGTVGQIAIWGVLFLWLGEFGTFAAAFYHSAVNFSTLGYGDIVMSERHRLLGPLESVNGVLMIGISSSALVAAFRDATRRTLQARGGWHGRGDGT